MSLLGVVEVVLHYPSHHSTKEAAMTQLIFPELIGQLYDKHAKEYIVGAGVSTYRVIDPNSVKTLEFNPLRLTVYVDNHHVITALEFS